jgi:hypothetical protein
MAFWGASLDIVSPELIQAKLWWRFEEVPSQDYVVSL